MCDRLVPKRHIFFKVSYQFQPVNFDYWSCCNFVITLEDSNRGVVSFADSFNFFVRDLK